MVAVLAICFVLFMAIGVPAIGVAYKYRPRTWEVRYEADRKRWRVAAKGERTSYHSTQQQAIEAADKRASRLIEIRAVDGRFLSVPYQADDVVWFDREGHMQGRHKHDL